MDSAISWAILLAFTIYLGYKLINRIESEIEMRKTRSEQTWEELVSETNANNWQDWCKADNHVGY